MSEQVLCVMLKVLQLCILFIFQNSEFECCNVEVQWHCNKAHYAKSTQIVHIIVLLTVQKCRAVYCKLQWKAQLASIPRRVAAVEVLLVPPGTQASRYYHIRTSCKDFLEQQASRYYDISCTGMGGM